MRVALLAVCAAAAGIGAGVAGRGEAEIRPCVAWMGDDSLIATPRYERIVTRERWEEVWREHTSARPQFEHPAFARSPEIDFGRYMVVACFRGKSTNNAGERVESIAEVDGAVRIRFDSMSYQTSSGVVHRVEPGEVNLKDGIDGKELEALKMGDGVNAVTPYGIWVIERSDKPVVLEEGVRGLKADPVTWKERHRFAALE